MSHRSKAPGAQLHIARECASDLPAHHLGTILIDYLCVSLYGQWLWDHSTRLFAYETTLAPRESRMISLGGETYRVTRLPDTGSYGLCLAIAPGTSLVTRRRGGYVPYAQVHVPGMAIASHSLRAVVHAIEPALQRLGFVGDRMCVGRVDLAVDLPVSPTELASGVWRSATRRLVYPIEATTPDTMHGYRSEACMEQRSYNLNVYDKLGFARSDQRDYVDWITKGGQAVPEAITRVEFQVYRPPLRDAGIDWPNELTRERVEALWSKLTSTWRLVTPETAHCPKRGQRLHPVWEQVVTARLAHHHVL